MKPPKARDVADLLRLPSLFTVPGDVLLGATISGRDGPLSQTGLIASSCALYAAGMALNDYADRDVDARERPKRPIPSGRVSPGFALALAGALTAMGIGLSRLAGGRRALGVSVPLAATVWAYDLAAKKTRWGPAAMAACRSLDVMMGAGGPGDTRVWPAAGIVGGHTFMITTVSRSEARGGTKKLGLGALAGTAAVTLAAAGLSLKESRSARVDPLRRRAWRIAALALLGAHAASMGRAEVKAAREPVAANLQRVVGTGVLGIMPLEGGMLAGVGAIGKAAMVAAGWRIARKLARRRPVT